MGEGYTLEIKDDLVHVVDEPGFVITIEAALERLRAIAKACKDNKCKKALIECNSPKRKMSTMDAYDSGSIFSDMGLFGIKLAFCFTDYTFDNTSRFLQTVASNRGVSIAFFNEKDKALLWLEK